MLSKQYLKLLIGLVVAIIIAFVARSVIVGHPVISLEPAPGLAGSVAQSFSIGDSKTLPVYGTDFTLENAHYFENKQWAVVTVNSVKHDFDPGVLVMKKVNGAYQAVLGPGSQFSDSYRVTLPNSVSRYLGESGYLHG